MEIKDLHVVFIYLSKITPNVNGLSKRNSIHFIYNIIFVHPSSYIRNTCFFNVLMEADIFKQNKYVVCYALSRGHYGLEKCLIHESQDLVYVGQHNQTVKIDSEIIG